jgi:hypothetical protein
LRQWQLASSYFSYQKIIFHSIPAWKQSICTCPFFQKQYHCKHIFGLAVVRNIIPLPQSTKDVPIGQKRKLGRPAGARKALLRQWMFTHYDGWKNYFDCNYNLIAWRMNKFVSFMINFVWLVQLCLIERFNFFVGKRVCLSDG